MVEASLKYNLDEATLKRAIDLMRSYGKTTNMTEKEMDDLEKSLRDVGRESQRSLSTSGNQMNNLGNIAKKVGGVVAGAFAVGQLLEYQKKIIQVTANFEKMGAVLTTALGKQSSAAIAMANLENFAAKTPFSVAQITESYVKLVNRGLEPSTKALTNMGDFAASTGKDLGTLVEAIMDVNNTERWNEFGVKVRTEGDKIRGTFKGMTIEAERTEAGALKMIQAFGEMEGVAGSMAGVSVTLEGKLSNLGDSFDRLFKSIGNKQSGPMKQVLDGLISMVDTLSGLIEDDMVEIEREAAAVFDTLRAGFGDLKTPEEYAAKIQEVEATMTDLKATWEQLDEQMVENSNNLREAEGRWITGRKEASEYRKEGERLEEEMRKTQVQFKANEEAVNFLNRAMKGLKEETKRFTGTWDDMIVTVYSSEEALYEAQGRHIKAVQEMHDLALQAWKDLNSTESLDQLIAETMEAAMEEYEEGTDEIVRTNTAAVDQMREDWERYNEFQREAFNGFVDWGLQMGNTLLEIGDIRRSKERAREEQHLQRQLEALGDNEEAKSALREEYERRWERQEANRAAWERRLFFIDQARQVANIVMSITAATAKSIGSSPLTLGQPWAGIIAAIGALAVSTVKGLSVPAFKDGTTRVTGEGGERDDKVLARLSVNERVVDAQSNRKIGFDMSNAELAKAAELYRALPYQLRGDLWQVRQQGGTLDMDLLAEKMSKPIVRAIRQKPVMGLEVSKEGIIPFEVRNGAKVRYLHKTYGIKP